MSENVQWNRERPGVFVGKCGGRIMGRVVKELKTWEWASYRNGRTHDAGQAGSFADACSAVEEQEKQTEKAG